MCDATGHVTGKSQWEAEATDLIDLALLAVTGMLLAITTWTAIKYYKLIHDARFEYEKAKGIVEEIVRSFNRELKRDTEKLDTLGYKIEGNSARSEVAIRRVESIEEKATLLDNQVTTIADVAQRAMVALTETGSKISSLTHEHESLKANVTNLQEQLEKLSALPEVRAEPVMPIKRDRAMASLTDTEIAVLEMLASEGAKTAPEIRERVQLSREHTARLMKKLYEEGYLERETGKIPFRYSVKKEMEKFLKKPENPQT